jgi:hypothetical protein
MPGLWVIVKSLGMHAGAVRDGSVALIRRPGPGRPGKLGDQDGAAADARQARARMSPSRRSGSSAAVQAPAGRRGRAAGRPARPAWPADLPARSRPWPTRSTRRHCRPCSPPRCSPPSRPCPASATSMITSWLIPGEACLQGLERQAGPGGERTRRHPRHHGRRPRRALRHRPCRCGSAG